MSYIAHRNREHCGSEWTAADLQQGRIEINIEINTIDAKDPHEKEG
jgi:hypothetical protein